MKESMITEKDQFLFSVHKHELLKIESIELLKTNRFSSNQLTSNNYEGIIVYNGVMNLQTSTIYFLPFNAPKLIINDIAQKQPYISIKNAIKVSKLETDVLGNIYKYKSPKDNKPKLELT